MASGKKRPAKSVSQRLPNAHFMRQWTLIYLLSTARCFLPYDKILEKLKDAGYPCCRRTLQRDLKVFMNSGWLLECSTRNDGSKWWRLKANSANSLPLPAEGNEVLALAMARNALTLTDFSWLSEHLDRLWIKLEQHYSDELCELYRNVSASLSVQSVQHPGGLENLGHYDQLMKAIREKRKGKFSYRNNAGSLTKNRVVAPLKLFIASGHTYLRAFCYSRNDKRNFRLSRIEGTITVLNEKYEASLLDGIEKDLEAALGAFHAEPERVVLEVDDMLGCYLEENPLHTTQKLLREKGHTLVELDIGLNETLFHKLMGFADHIRVLEPAKLRALLVERHRMAAEALSSSDGESAIQPELPLSYEE